MQKCGLSGHKNCVKIGAITAVTEALIFAIFRKSWDGIVSIQIEKKNNEGTVGYNDSIMTGPDKCSDELLHTYHLCSVLNSSMVAECIDNEFLTKEEFIAYITGFNAACPDEEKCNGLDVLRDIICYKIADYLPFIEACANELKVGIRYPKEKLEEKFINMGYTFPNP